MIVDPTDIADLVRLADAELTREDWHDRAAVLRSLLQHAMPHLRQELNRWFDGQLDLLRAAETREKASKIRSHLSWMGMRNEISREQWLMVSDVFHSRWRQGVLGTASDGHYGD
jgi:hypothetical protein